MWELRPYQNDMLFPTYKSHVVHWHLTFRLGFALFYGYVLELGETANCEMII